MTAWALGQFILDCDGQRDAKNPTCTLLPYHPPPATQEVFQFAPGVTYFVAAVVVIALIIATAIVRYRRHERLESEFRARQETEDIKARAIYTQCPTCGDKYPVGPA